MKFYERGNRGTMCGPPSFNPMAASIKIFRATKGVAADKRSITEILAYHTCQQRQELVQKYQYVYKKDLAEVLDAELSSNYGKIVSALIVEPEDYVITCIQRAITPQKSGAKKLVRRLSQLFSNGLGKDEHVLIDLLCNKSNAYLAALKDTYKAKYGEDLSEKIAEEGNMLPRDFCNIIEDMLACERDETEQVDMDKLNEDLEDLEDDDVKEIALQSIFQERSYPYIRRIFAEYRKKTGNSLQTMIEENQKFSEPVKGAYVAIYTKIRNEHQFYAERLRMAVEGVGRDDDALIRIVVLRSEVDLLDIMEAFKDKYGVDLGTNVYNETSGDYREVLMRIIRVPDAEEMKAALGVKREDVNVQDMVGLNLDEIKLQALLEEVGMDEERDAGEEKDD